MPDEKRSARDVNVDYILVRSKRRSIAIVIDPHKGVIVRAPLKTPIKTIEAFLLKKIDWIKKKVKDLGGIQEKKELFDSGNLSYKGKLIPLVLEEYEKKRVKITLEEKLQVLYNPQLHDEQKLRKGIEAWLKKQALNYTQKVTEHYYDTFIKKQFPTIDMPVVKIRTYKRRWGAASSEGIITYNWKLIMAPKEILNYVVVHELCHLIYFDHSKKYWELVEAIIEDYKERRKWLKLNGHKLSV